jgi:hypothetical protein
MRDYLATLDDAAFGAASDVTPKFVSPSDPAAQWTGAMRGPAFFAYADNYFSRREVRHHHGCRGVTHDPPRLVWARRVADCRACGEGKRSYRCEASPNRSAEPRLDGTV